MKAQNKVQSDCDVKVAIDKGSIRLSFPKRHTPLWELMDGKSLNGKPKYLYLGKAGFSNANPDDVRRAELIAVQMASDLDHPEWDKLFDRTLEKYGLAGLLGGKYAKLADVIQLHSIPQVEPEITVGAMWEAYLDWKKTVVEETTFKTTYVVHFTNALKPLLGASLDDLDSLTSYIDSLKISKKQNFLTALNEAYQYSLSKKLVKTTTGNPFVLDKFGTPTVSTQQKYANKTINGEEKEWHEVTDEKILENDKRAFTKEERDIIIKAFYESNSASVNLLSPLIEFLFLTGCRPSEAIGLKWNNTAVPAVMRYSSNN